MSLSKEPSGYIHDPMTGTYQRNHRKRFLGDIPRPKLLSFFNTRDATANLLPSLLNNRAYGLINNSNFRSNFLELKAEGAKQQFSKEAIGYDGWKFFEFDALGLTDRISMLKGSAETMYAVWQTSADKKIPNFIGNIQHFLSPSGSCENIRLKAVNFPIIDICEAYIRPRSAVAVGNCPMSLTGLVMFITSKNQVFIVRRSCRKADRAPVFCCAANKFCNQYACGRENFISVIDPRREEVEKRDLSGSIRAVEFDKLGNVLYAGTRDGRFAVLDLRQKVPAAEMKFSDHGVDEAKLFSDEQTMIVGDMAGNLCKMDLRQKDIVTTYEGHIRTRKRMPFNFQEEFNILCATGSDNRVRLWSLDGGNPIKQFQFDDPTVSSRAWLVGKDNKCYLYHVQNTAVRVHKIAP